MRLKTTLICLFYAIKLMAQTAQLPFDQGRFTSISSLIEAGKDSFICSSAIIAGNTISGGKINNLTHVSLSKGVLWSFDFSFPKTSISSKLTNFKDGFLWSNFVFDVNQTKSLMRLDKKGNIIWSKRYGGLNDVDTLNGGVNEAIALPDGTIAFAGGAASFGATTRSNDLFLAKLDSNGNQLWAKNYIFSSLPNTYSNFNNLIATSDGGFLLCGSIYTPSEKGMLLLKTDANGTVQWTRSYADAAGGFLSNESGIQVIQLPDGSYTLIGNQREIIGNSSTIIAQINSNGTFLRAIRVRVNPDARYSLRANKVIYDRANNAFIIGAGVVQDSTPSVSVEQNVLYKLRLEGVFDWKYNYYDEILQGFGTSYSDLVQTKNGGFAHLTSFSLGFDNLYPILIASDAKGITGCEQPINLVIEKNFSLSSKTYSITEKNASPAIDYAANKIPFNFSVKLPTLNLGNDTAICKTDTSFILNASDSNIDTYKWSTGASTPQITVSQLGQYAVSVTSTKYCLTLNDTISITKSTQCDSDFKLDIPNSFTPNNDGLNDIFEPFGKGFTIKYFKIYNRWGNLVFESVGNLIAWNGQVKGQDAASDVYVYSLKYEVNGKEMSLSGEVSLIR